MTYSDRRAPTITLSEGFSNVVVQGPGIDVEFREGHVIIRSGTVEDLTKTAPAVSKPDPEIGHVFPAGHAQAGLVYAGRTADGKQHIVAEPVDAMGPSGKKRLGLTFDKAVQHTAAKGMALLPIEDMKLLCDRRKRIGGFKERGLYWSADITIYGHVWVLRFSDGGSEMFDSGKEYCGRRVPVI